MSRFDSGVDSYVIGRCVVEVAFPVDRRGKAEIACKHCNFFSRSSQRCGITNQVINYPEHFVGTKCPLIYEENKENKDEI